MKGKKNTEIGPWNEVKNLFLKRSKNSKNETVEDFRNFWKTIENDFVRSNNEGKGVGQNEVINCVAEK